MRRDGSRRIASRRKALSVAALLPYLNEVAGLAVGGVASAFYGARFVSAIKSEHLIKIIAALLGAWRIDPFRDRLSI